MAQRTSLTSRSSASFSKRRLIAGGRYSIEFAVGVALDKYLMHLPLERQVKQMALAGLNVTSQTLWDQLWTVASYLKPCWEALWTYQLQSPVIGVDETRWRLLDKRGHAKPQIIAVTSESAVCYAFEYNKTAETLDRLLGDFSGWLIVDGISIYPAVRDIREAGYGNGSRDGPPFRIANCWAHFRRYLVKASKDFRQAERMVELIAMLYRVVDGARDERVTAGERRQWVEALLGEMRRWMHTTKTVPDSSLHKAIAYGSKYWKGLTRFVDHPEVWLDNNASERALRRPVLGRKNHYGSKSERGMLAAAVFYSLIETCQIIGVHPAEYLREAIRRAKEKPGTAYLPHEMLTPN
jgi:transposase